MLAAIASTAIATLALAFPLQARDARAAAHPSETRPRAEATYATGTVILKLRRGVANERRGVEFDVPAIDAVMQQIGASSRTPLFPRAPMSSTPAGVSGAAPSDAGFDRVYIVGYDGPFDPKWVSERLAATSAVDYAEPYYFFTTDGSPVNDPQLAQQYWLSVIKAQEAWDVTLGSPDVLIAIIDSGVDWTHEDLSESIWENVAETGTDGQGNDRRTNGVDDDGNGFTDDWHGWDLVGNVSIEDLMSRRFAPDNNAAPLLNGTHGTTVAGCAAARTNNGKGIASPGYSASILPVKVAADSVTTAISAGYEGIIYAADMRAAIINCSFGGAITGGSQALQQVIDYASAQGALVVAASGNSGQNVEAVTHVPAGLNGVLSVGATGMSDYADTSYTNSGLGVHVYAPGTNVLTTYPGNRYAGNGITGTSFSSPITAGVASLVLAVHPTWSAAQVATQLRITGDRTNINNASRFAPHFFRRVNAKRAVTINRSFDSGERMPGLAIESFRLNGRTRDTIRSLDDVMTVTLSLKNLLAPTTDLKIDTWPGQMLRARSVVSVPTIATAASAMVDIELEIDPESAERFSEGSFDLVLRLRDGSFEDVLPVRIPVKLAGWRQMAKFGGPSTAYATQSIAAPTPTAGWAVANVNGERPAFTRTSDGRSWATFRNIATTTEPVYCVAAVSAQLAWAGASPSSGSAAVYRTINGGTSWQKTAVTTITPFINAIHFFDENEGILIGDPRSSRWGIGMTTDGGATWRALPSPVPAGAGEAGWNNSFTAFGDNLWFGTNNNRIYRSTDRGYTWTSAQTPGVASFSLAFTSATEGLAVFKRTVSGQTWVGANALAVTRNGGISWQTIQLPYGMTADAATAIPGTNRILVATESGIVETADLGATWTVVAAPASVFNWKASESGARYGTGVQLAAATADGAVAAFGVNGTGTIIGYREEAPSAAPLEAEATRGTLLEPFPNPTGDLTTIGFELAAPANVALRLFDARGVEVRTLLAERRESGRHAVVVDAASLAAGTYHVVLTVDGERSTKPVVIVR